MNEKLARLVKQHAETSRLFGVDFVPRYRTAASLAAEAAPRDVAVAAAAATKLAAPPSQLPALPPAAYEPGSKKHAAQALLDAVRARYIKDAPHRTFARESEGQIANIVFGEGDPCARVMFIGEAPGQEEDIAGRPFVGRAGGLLGKMIQAMGLSRQTVYLTNVLKTKLPENTASQSHEVRACLPYLLDQIAAVKPEVIVTLGLTATEAVLGTLAEPAGSRTIASLRSQWAKLEYQGLGSIGQRISLSIAVMPTYAPSYVLENYDAPTRKLVWDDLQMVMDKLGLTGPAAKK